MHSSKTNRSSHDVHRQQDDWDDVHHQLLTIQKKSLEINNPHDANEKEADEAAQKVVNGESAEIHGAGGTISRKEELTEEATPEFQSKLETNRGNGQSLDETTRGEMENKMGADFSGVKIHTGNEAHEMSESVNAKAFTQGKDIYFKQGEFNPNSKQGKELLAHELVHTKQQENSVQRKVQRQIDPTVVKEGTELKSEKAGKGNISIRKGDKVMAGSGQIVDNLISFGYQGADADKIHWIQFVNIQMKAVTNDGDVYHKGYAMNTSAGAKKYTDDPQKPNWTVDSDPRAKSPYYDVGYGKIDKPGKESRMFDRPGGASWQPEIDSFVKWDKDARNFKYGFLITTFETYLIQDDKAVYRIRWNSYTTFKRKEQPPLVMNGITVPRIISFPDVLVDDNVTYGPVFSESVDGLPEDFKKVLETEYAAYKFIK